VLAHHDLVCCYRGAGERCASAGDTQLLAHLTNVDTRSSAASALAKIRWSKPEQRIAQKVRAKMQRRDRGQFTTKEKR
jgi:hypothetical protein